MKRDIARGSVDYRSDRNSDNKRGGGDGSRTRVLMAMNAARYMLSRR